MNKLTMKLGLKFESNIKLRRIISSFKNSDKKLN